jgi:hypothetical protein
MYGWWETILKNKNNNVDTLVEKYSMWTKVIPFPPSSLYISYKTIYFHNILMKSFLI